LGGWLAATTFATAGGLELASPTQGQGMLRVCALLCFFAGLGTCVVLAWRSAARHTGLPPYDPQQIENERSPHRGVPIRPWHEVHPSEVSDDELVLGVQIGDEARAYPINQLSEPTRECFNETLGGRAIAVTWCDLCHNGIVYLREVADRELTFYICGKLWVGSAVLMDVETRSEWSQVLGRAMKGPLQDTRLAVLPSAIMTWRQWKEDHPDTSVSVLGRTSQKYRPTIYADQSLFVVGLRDNDKAVSYTFEQLNEERAINDSLNSQPVLVGFDPVASGAFAYSRVVDGEILNFEIVEDGQLVGGGSRWSRTTGKALDGPWQGKRLKPLPLLTCYRDAWERFYPHSRWWGARG
jgi:hypothetical protein